MESRKETNCCTDIDGNPSSTRLNVHAIINKEVRMSSSQALGLKKDTIVYCGAINDTNNKAVGGPGDFNGGGLSKKHNSYDRYLARKKGKIEYYSERKDRLNGFTMLSSGGYLCN